MTTRPTWSRKTYEMTAQTIRAHVTATRAVYEGIELDIAIGSIDSLARDLAAQFYGDNPRFDEYKFLTACGL